MPAFRSTLGRMREVPMKGYVASAPELRQPIVALSLGGLRRRIEIALLAR
jgi:hypothetical protein